MTTYQAWIDDFIAEHDGDVRYLCAAATIAICKAFPELREARGYLVDARAGLTDADFKDERGHSKYPVGGPAHIWCVAPDGTIVDPTASQFGIPPEHLQYFEHDDAKHGTLPRGKCPNCGFFRYGPSVCDLPECAADYERWLQRSVEELRDRG